MKKEKSGLNAWEDLTRNRALNDALAIVRKLDAPERPVVPQCVADFYESIKDDFEVGVFELCVKLYNCDLSGEIRHWFDCDDTDPIQTLVNVKSNRSDCEIVGNIYENPEFLEEK